MAIGGILGFFIGGKYAENLLERQIKYALVQYIETSEAKEKFYKEESVNYNDDAIANPGSVQLYEQKVLLFELIKSLRKSSHADKKLKEFNGKIPCAKTQQIREDCEKEVNAKRFFIVVLFGMGGVFLGLIVGRRISETVAGTIYNHNLNSEQRDGFFR
jgi:hypothetical protein